jgi:hypothetical protein
VYILEVGGVQLVPTARWPKLRIGANVDNEQLGWQEIDAAVRNGNVYFITPVLTNGIHDLRIVWDNVYDDSRLRITGIRLLNYAGSDNNANGTPDWVDHRLDSTCTWDPIRSLKVSPVCIEGTSLFLRKMNRWYADVPLSATNATGIQVKFEDGSRVISRTLNWEPTDILSSSNITLRKGDALRLTTAPTGATNGTVTIVIPGITNCVTDAFNPVVTRFDTQGTFAVTGTYASGSNTSSKTISIQVVAASFPTNLSAVLLNRYREMVNPAIPLTGVVVQGDSATVLGNPGKSGLGRRYTVSLKEVDTEHYLVARLDNEGAVLDSTPLLGTWMREGDTGFRFVEVLTGGSVVWESTVRTGGFPVDGLIEVQIFAGGALFEDGSSLLRMTPSSLDALGSTNFKIVVPPGGKICHHVSLVQNGVSMKLK